MIIAENSINLQNAISFSILYSLNEFVDYTEKLYTSLRAIPGLVVIILVLCFKGQTKSPPNRAFGQ